MWQRFTERARRVVFFAQEEAGRLGENNVSTEHLLLGLVRERDSCAAKILEAMGVDVRLVRREVEGQVTRGRGRFGQDMQLTVGGKRVIDTRYEEARSLGNNYSGTEHLLLGLIHENEGVGARVLQKLGVDLDRARGEVANLQDGGMTGAGSTLEFETPAMRNEARKILAEVVKEHGTAIRTDRKRCESLLWERHGDYRREIMALVLVLQEGIVDELISMSETKPKLVLLERLADKATEQTPIDRKCAIWAAASWATALGIMGEPKPESGESSGDRG